MKSCGCERTAGAAGDGVRGNGGERCVRTGWLLWLL